MEESNRAHIIWNSWWIQSNHGTNLQFSTNEIAIVDAITSLLQKRASEIHVDVFRSSIQNLIHMAEEIKSANVPYLSLHSFVWKASWYISGNTFENFSQQRYLDSPQSLLDMIEVDSVQHLKEVSEQAKNGHFFEILISGSHEGDFASTFYIPLSRLEFKLSLEKSDNGEDAWSFLRHDKGHGLQQIPSRGLSREHRSKLYQLAATNLIQEKIALYGLSYFVGLQHQKFLQFFEKVNKDPELFYQIGRILYSFCHEMRIFEIKMAAEKFLKGNYKLDLGEGKSLSSFTQLNQHSLDLPRKNGHII